MKCWLCGKEGADADSTMGSMAGVPYHRACVRCPKCGGIDIIWRLWREKLECMRCLDCGVTSIRIEGNKWQAVHN